MKIKSIYIIFFSLILNEYSSADDSNLNSYQFLNSHYSPRLVALGGIYPTISGDLNAQFGNPAGLANLKTPALMFTYTNFLLDFNGGFLGYHQPVSGRINLSLGLLYMDYGTFERIDDFAIMTGEKFESRDLALQSSASGNFQDWFNYGVTLKYVYSKISHFSATALAADVGLLANVPYFENLKFGFSLNNIGKSIDAFDRTKEKLPMVFSMGFAKYFWDNKYSIYFGWNQLPVYTSSNDELYQNFAVGLESSLTSSLKIRIGYNNGIRENLMLDNYPKILGISGGFALQFGLQQLAYGYSNYGDLGGIHIFGFTYSFSRADHEIRSSNISREGDLSLNLNEIPPPYQLQYNFVSDKLLISWRGFEGISYNIYAKHGDNQNWIKMNSKPIRDNFVAFKRPQIPGFYYFKLTSVYENEESYFSEQIEIKID